jgi:5-methylcytosine-specific restriction endonuclease McrA
MDDERYNLARWKKLRGLQLHREPLCFYCKISGRLIRATTVDHAIPTSRGGDFWAMANLRSSCAHCNYSKKDQTEDEFLTHGCGEDGMPLSGSHPWNMEANNG